MSPALADLHTGATWKSICTALYYHREWVGFSPLEHLAFHQLIPHRHGLYTVYLVNAAAQRTETVYVGQSYDLHVRLATLRREVGKAEQPDGSHHFAAPKLWQIRQHQPQSHLAFSLFLFARPVPRPLLPGFECLALYAARLRDPFPALVNFGSQADWPVGQATRPYPLAGEITSRSWLGLPWSEWTPLAALPAKPGQGFYRVRLPGQVRFAYVGYGHIKEGVRRRLAGSGEGYEVSWACHAGWSAYDYQSLKNDLVASHVFHLGLAPSLQFAGE